MKEFKCSDLTARMNVSLKITPLSSMGTSFHMRLPQSRTSRHCTSRPLVETSLNQQIIGTNLPKEIYGDGMIPTHAALHKSTHHPTPDSHGQRRAKFIPTLLAQASRSFFYYIVRLDINPSTRLLGFETDCMHVIECRQKTNTRRTHLGRCTLISIYPSRYGTHVHPVLSRW